jgi:nicotinamidase/pyrazinamidase
MLSIDRRKDALVVVDLQPDFMPGGPLAVAEGDRIAEPIGRLARRFDVVVATQDFHPAGHISFASSHRGRAPFEMMDLYGGKQVLWPDHCVQGTPGALLHPALPDEKITLILRKGIHPELDSYSGFRENLGPDGKRPSTGLAGWLRERGVTRIFVVGLARDFCVKFTALDGAAEGFESIVVDDLTRAVAPERHSETDAELEEAGVKRVQSEAIG